MTKRVKNPEPLPLVGELTEAEHVALMAAARGGEVEHLALLNLIAGGFVDDDGRMTARGRGHLNDHGGG